MTGMRFAAGALALAACFTGGAQAQEGAAPRSNPKMFAAGSLDAVKRLTPEQRQERRFLQDAAANLRLQSQASRLALEKSTHGGVRQVAAALLNHYNMVQPEILHLLHARGMAMPLMRTEESKVLKQLARLSGPRFDRLYMEEVAWRANEADAAQYERIAAVSRDAQLQAWAERHLPTLRYHVQLAGRAHAPAAEAPRMASGRHAAGAPGAIVETGSRAAAAVARPAAAPGGVLKVSEPNSR